MRSTNVTTMKRSVQVGLIAGGILLFGGGLVLGATVLGGNDDPPVVPLASPSPSPSPSPTSSSTPSPTPAPSPSPSPSPSPTLVEDCSAGELDSKIQPDPDLPTKVDKMRLRIWAAARACDFDLLDEIAREGSGRFTYSFGVDDLPQPGEIAAHLRREDKRFDAVRVLAQILELPGCVVDDVGEGAAVSAWPEIYCDDNPSNEDWNALRGIYTPEEIRTNKTFGHYLLYRAGITEKGDWIYYVAGD
jgi:hypothetical protein